MSTFSQILTEQLNTVQIYGSGLSNLQNTVLNNWIQPIFLVAIAVFAIIFIKDRAWMKLIGFIGIAAVVAIPVFMGETFFGSDGKLSGVAEDAASQINAVNIYDFFLM